MFWRMTPLSTVSPVDSVLDKDTFTLEELLDEEDLIQECKSLNTRLINFLRAKPQIEQLLRYVVEEPPEKSDDKRAFKFPFIACEIFACEIDAILKTIEEDEELMGLLFFFLDPDRPHGTLLSGYFSKVVISLLLRKTSGVMSYLKAHQIILKKLVDLIAITSIMEVLIRLVAVDESINAINAFSEDSVHWLAETDLLELLMEKLTSLNPSDAHANAAEVLCAVSSLSQSSLAAKLSSPSYISRLFHHALEDPDSKSTLVHSLTVCISLVDPKKYMLVGMGRGQYMPTLSSGANPAIVESMLPRLGDLIKLLDVSSDEEVLPTTYGELQPPLGTHRLKIIEFVAVLLRANIEGAQQTLVQLGAIKIVITLFFEYPFNNLLHNQVERIITSCLESNTDLLIDHLLEDCSLVERLLEADLHPYPHIGNKPTRLVADKPPPRTGVIGHLTRIANRLVQAANHHPGIQNHLQGKSEWVQWQESVLRSRNFTENVCQWTCGRPTTVRDRPVDSDDGDTEEYSFWDGTNTAVDHLRDDLFGNERPNEGIGTRERDDDDVFFDDESAEVVISSLRLGEEHNSGQLKDHFLSRANWLAFSDDSSSSDDEVVVGEDEELLDTATSLDNPLENSDDMQNGHGEYGVHGVAASNHDDIDAVNSVENLFSDMGAIQICSVTSNGGARLDGDRFSERSLDWVNWKDPVFLEDTAEEMALSSNTLIKDHSESTAEEIDQALLPVLEPEIDVKLVDVPSPLVVFEHQDAFSRNQDSNDLEDCDHIKAEKNFREMDHALQEDGIGHVAPIHPPKHAMPNNVEAQGDVEPIGELDFDDVNSGKGQNDPTGTEVESI